MNHKQLLAFAGKAWPVIEKGKIVHLVREPETPETEIVPLPEGVEGYLDEHPEGADRGGYLPTLKSGNAEIQYDDQTGIWG
jgi:hypothetical protein